MKNLIIFPLAACLLALAACSSESKAPVKLPPPLPTIKLTLLPQSEMARGRPVNVLMKLTNIKTHELLTDADLETAHTKKIHLFIIDPTLSDYHYVHPAPTATPGLYSFAFTPRLGEGYHVWAEITPKATHREEFDMAELGPHHEADARKVESHSATVSGYRFVLSFDKPPVADGESMGTITITRGGHAVTLSPIMGAYAHITAFFQNYRTVMHTHPMGDDSHEIMFHFAPDRDGFVKLFAQVNIGGKEITAPFGIVIPRVMKQP